MAGTSSKGIHSIRSDSFCSVGSPTRIAVVARKSSALSERLEHLVASFGWEAPRRVWWGREYGIIALQLACSAISQRLDATIQALLETARIQEIALTPDHIVRARAYDLIEHVDLEFEHLRGNGTMRALDQAFMAERRRRPSLRHEEFARRLKIRMLYAIAEAPSL